MTTPGAPAPPPDDLPALRAWLAAQDDADLLADLPIREIVVKSNALTRLPGLLADLDNVARGRAAIGGQPTAVVALGSGSVCDVAKHTCYLAEREDNTSTTLVLVPTAASVTAFTSSLAVLLVDGVKRTRPSR